MSKAPPKPLGTVAAEYALDMARRIAANGGESSSTAERHPLTGLFCLKSSTDPEMTKYGWNWQYQCRVHSVIGGTAMLQYYSAMDGCPTSIEPIPLADLLSGEWRFYDDRETWLGTAEEASTRYWRRYRLVQERRHEA